MIEFLKVHKRELYFQWDHKKTPSRPHSTCCIMHAGRVVVRGDSYQDVAALYRDVKFDNVESMVAIKYE